MKTQKIKHEEQYLKEKFIEKHKLEFEKFVNKMKSYKKFKPCGGEVYWYIDDEGNVKEAYWRGIAMDQYRLNNSYLFQTKEECAKYREFLDDIAAEAITPKIFADNFCLEYRYKEEAILIVNDSWGTRGNVYFKRDGISRLIKKYGDDYLKAYLLNVWEWED